MSCVELIALAVFPFVRKNWRRLVASGDPTGDVRVNPHLAGPYPSRRIALPRVNNLSIHSPTAYLRLRLCQQPRQVAPQPLDAAGFGNHFRQ